MRRRDHNLFVNIGSLVLCGVLAGVVVAAALFPGIAISGLAAKAGAEEFDRLPSELQVDTAPQMSYIYARDGKKIIATMYDEHRRDIPLSEVPQVMIDALVAAEDKAFFRHNGIDPQGILRAFVANTRAGQTTQGASTITQQVVRMALTYFAKHPQDALDATEQTTARKLREARYAIALEKEWSKERILETYFNLSYFGQGAFGIFAASQVYYGKAPKDLELHEAAMLAALVKAPSDLDPSLEENVPLAKDRRDWVLDQMVETGAITAEEAAEAKEIDVKVEARRQPNDCVATSKNHWGFFCDFFYRWWLEQETFGSTRYERERRLKGGGFRIVTTLDVDIQDSAKKHVEENLETGDPHALMLAAIEPGTGKVRAMAVNRRFALDDPEKPKNGPHTNPALRNQGVRGSYPNTTNPLIAGGGDVTGYQAGSTFKMFTIVAALEQGIPLAYTIDSPYRVTTDYPVEPGGPASCGNKWCPSNYAESVGGVHNMWTGMGRSVNTFFAQLIERAGAQNVVDVAERLGIKFRAEQDAQYAKNADSWGAFTLGVSATTPLDLANAYATVSAEGIHCEPIPVEEIRTMDGEKLDIANPRCKRVLDKDVARAAIDAGRCVVGEQSHYGRCQGGTASETRGIVGKPIWGKTGTSDGSKTYSFVVSTRTLTVAAQLADPDWAQTNQRMQSAPVRAAVSRTLADAMKGTDPGNWPAPKNTKLVHGDQVGIPSVQCRSVSDAQAILRDAGFKVKVQDTPVDSSCPAGTVAGTSPSGRTIRGGHVAIQISNGSGAQQPDRDDSPSRQNRDDQNGPSAPPAGPQMPPVGPEPEPRG